MWLKFTILYILFVKIVISEEIGDKCVPNEVATEGSCKLINDCKVAVRAIKLFFYHPFKRCGFSEILEVVCCPTKEYVLPEPTKRITTPAISTTTPSTQKKFSEIQPKRIADTECQKIAASGRPPLDEYITGGVEAAQGEFPHMVALGYNRPDGYLFQCGGSLISDRYILTAAHCVDTLDSIKPTIVRMGRINISDSTFNQVTDGRIEDIILHPKYTRRNKYHDLALIRLEKAVKYNENLNAICLYTLTDDPQIDLMVTGWGRTNLMRDAGSEILLKAKVTVVSISKCRESYNTGWRRLPNGITDEQICAGDKEGIRDTCQGDSGGPLQGLTGLDGLYRLIGITSFGRGCGSPIPGVYTRISSYLDWIESVVWPN